MTNTASAAPSFRFLGTTDECIECQQCGRADLRSTVVLAILDEEGNVTDTTYYGSSCAARALGIKGGGRVVLDSARNARVATLRAAHAAHRSAAMHERIARFNESGGLEWVRPAVVRNAHEGVESAVKRVAAIRALADPIFDAAIIGFPTLAAVEKELRAGGWL